MLKVAALIYEGFANHELLFACHEFRRQEIFTVGPEKKLYTSTEKQQLMAQRTIESLAPGEADVLIIPGGFTDRLYENEAVLNLIRGHHESGGITAGICGGTFLMALSGILKNRKCTGHFMQFDSEEPEYRFFREAEIVDANVVVDGSIVTARGTAFIEFGLVLAKTCGLFPKEEDFHDECSWLLGRTL